MSDPLALLHRQACALIRLGHVRVWDYGITLFLTAIDEVRGGPEK